MTSDIEWGGWLLTERDKPELESPNSI